MPEQAALTLTVLGSGTCELRPDASSPAYLVTSGERGLLLDMGQGALRRLMEEGFDPLNLDGALISHHHPDHLADLMPLLFALRYDPRLNAGANMTLVGHHALAQIVSGLDQVFGHWLRPGSPPLTWRLLSPGEGLDLGNVRVTSSAARHIGSSLAYRLECGGASLVYLGDSEADDELVAFAREADLVIAHCAGDDQAPKTGHLHPAAAGRLAQAAGAGGLLLSHLYRGVDPREALASARRIFAGTVALAYDGLVWELPAKAGAPTTNL
jgi:ribonuclease BN (tRNA processing enzyme)